MPSNLARDSNGSDTYRIEESESFHNDNDDINEISLIDKQIDSFFTVL